MPSSAAPKSHARSKSLPPQVSRPHLVRKEAQSHKLDKRSSLAGSSTPSLASTVMAQPKQGSQAHHNPRSKRHSLLLNSPASSSRLSLIGLSWNNRSDDQDHEEPRLLSQNVPDLRSCTNLANPDHSSSPSSVMNSPSSSLSLIEQQRKRRAERARNAASWAGPNGSTVSLQSAYSTDSLATSDNGENNRLSSITNFTRGTRKLTVNPCLDYTTPRPMRYYAQQKEMERLMRSVPKIAELPFEKKDDDDSIEQKEPNVYKEKAEGKKGVAAAHQRRLPEPSRQSLSRSQNQGQQQHAQPKLRQPQTQKLVPRGAAPAPAPKQKAEVVAQATSPQARPELRPKKSMKSMFQSISQKISRRKPQRNNDAKHASMPAIQVA